MNIIEISWTISLIKSNQNFKHHSCKLAALIGNDWLLLCCATLHQTCLYQSSSGNSQEKYVSKEIVSICRWGTSKILNIFLSSVKNTVKHVQRGSTVYSRYNRTDVVVVCTIICLMGMKSALWRTRSKIFARWGLMKASSREKREMETSRLDYSWRSCSVCKTCSYCRWIETYSNQAE